MVWKQYIASFLVVVGVAACSSSTGSDAPEGAQVAASTKSRLALETLTGAKVQELALANLAFGADLYTQLKGESANLFFSPHSISTALAMTYAGARGTTYTQMKQALHFELADADLHPAFNALDQELASRGKGASGKDGKPFRLNVVNQAWGQKDFVFRQEYLDVLAEHYGAGLYLLDFVTQAERSRQTINGWVAEQTEERIKNLIPAGIINNTTRLVLTNAIYFNASWKFPFKPAETSDQPFTTLAGETVQVPTMHINHKLRYAEAETWQAVELPYSGDELSMVALLPKSGAMDDVEGTLAQSLVDAFNGLQERGVEMSMPKFEVTREASLKDPLIALGMSDAFGNADFSGMTENASLAIQDVVHKAFVSVDEAGTEAAAATAVIVNETSVPESAEIYLNRPFIFAIRDNATGAVLFLGRIADPSKAE